MLLSSAALIKQISGWQVLDEESLSDHKYISFGLDEDIKSKEKFLSPVRKWLYTYRRWYEKRPPRNGKNSTKKCKLGGQRMGHANKKVLRFTPQ